MRIDQLFLNAYGPFTDRVLDFEGEGLQLVYGPNEAGKSSALRALTALLYGIGNDTTDNHLHTNTALRIGGVLKNADGQIQHLVRRKGRTKTLLSADNTALDDQVLTPFLHGVSKELFQSLFGIDHAALVNGGQDILQQKGEVGQALFSAALGSHTLHDVLASLDQEAESLFKPRATNPSINAAVRAFGKLNKQTARSALLVSEWEKHQGARDDAIEQMCTVDDELAAERAEVNHLQRLQRVLPKMVQRQTLMAELSQLGDVLVLPDDFSDQRKEAQQALRLAQTNVEKLSQQLEQWQAELEQIPLNMALLSQAQDIEALHAGLSSYREDCIKRPTLDIEHKQLSADAQSILQSIKPAAGVQEIDALRLIIARKKAIAGLVRQHALMQQARDKAATDLQESERRVQEIKADLAKRPPAAPTDALKGSIAVAARQGELDSLIDSDRSELMTLQSACNDELARLGMWSGPLNELASVQLPSRESIEAFHDRYDKLVKQQEKLTEQLDNSHKLQQGINQELDEIHRVGQVMTEATLVSLRKHRDSLWHLLRRQWLNREDVSIEVQQYCKDGDTLHDTFEQRLAEADDTSDRLRRETDRVLKLANLESRLQSELQTASQLTQQLFGCDTDKSTLDGEWQRLWQAANIMPATAREMRTWLDRIEALRDRVASLRSLEARLAKRVQSRQFHTDALIHQMASLDAQVADNGSIETLLLVCQAKVSDMDQSSRESTALGVDLEKASTEMANQQQELQAVDATLDTWKLQWDAQMQALALSTDTQPVEMDDLTDNVRLLFDKFGEADARQSTISSLDSKIGTFEEHVTRLVASVAPQLAELAADEAVVQLNALLKQNQSSQQLQAKIREQIAKANDEMQTSVTTITSNNEQLKALCLAAHCEDPALLDALERRSAEYVGLKKAIHTLESDIALAGDGIAINALEQQAQCVDIDALPTQISALNLRISDDLEPRRAELASIKGAEDNELKRMDGSDGAAQSAEQASAVLASIRSDTERYVQLKLAARILRQQIDTYREQNQGPMIRRASEHFSALTLQAFERLITEFNNRDEPVLAGIRANESRPVQVTGMSSGTLDQLYLALRLASLEKYIASVEPMPFIVDDVLIEFDDDRSQAALQALADLSAKTQVIVFTHHMRVLEQAENVTGKVQTHRL